MLGGSASTSAAEGRPTRTARGRTWLGLVVAMILTGSPACAVAVDGVGTAAPGPAPETPPPTSTPQATASSAVPAPTGDGDTESNAPFDVCGTITWADFPAAVRPANPLREPVPMDLDEDDVIAAGCRYDNSEAVEIEICVPPPCADTSPPELGDPFLVNIVWRTTALDPDNQPSESYPVRIEGSRGVVLPGRNTANGRDDPQCAVGVDLSRGAGIVAVTDGRFGIDPCELAQTLVTLIARRAT